MDRADRGAGVPDREPVGAAGDLELPGARDRRASRSPTTSTAYGRARHVQALWNSLRARRRRGACSPACSACRSPGRSRAPTCRRKGFIRLMVLGAFIMPPYLGAVGWILLAGPNAGWLNKVWMALTGAEHGIFNVYTHDRADRGRRASRRSPTCSCSPASALDLVSSEMEDAANILGAGTLRTTLPRHAAAGAAGDPRRPDHLRSSRRSRCSARPR